jgi:hypothetical protein
MNIKFKQIDDKRIHILDASNDKVIGRIFTPAGTMEDKTDGIQICGFKKFVEFWGCGLYGDSKGNATKDVQLLFEPSSQPMRIEVDLGERICSRCFYPYKKCQCLDMAQQLNDAADEIKNHYSEDRKHLICKELERN